MKLKDLAALPSPAKPPTPRLLELRATLAGFCVATEASWFARHAFEANGICSRCGQKAEHPKP